MTPNREARALRGGSWPAGWPIHPSKSRGPCLGSRRMARPTVTTLLAMALFAVLGPLAVGCGGGSSTSSEVLTELQRVAPVAEGTPALVFVYTDG